MNARGISVALLFSVFLTTFACAADDTLNPARQAAEQWLALLDGGQYAQSWDEASSLFKAHISRQDWTDKVSSVRAPLGKMQSRQLKGAQYETKLPGAPEGEYWVIQFRTKYAGGGPAIETITPMLDKDGQWRVSGYFVKPAE